MWSLIRQNKRRSAVLVAVMALALAAVGAAFGELFLGSGGWLFGTPAGLLIWLIMLAVSLSAGDGILLSAANAVPIDEKRFSKLFNVVEEMKIASGLEALPKIYIIDTPALNAFAAGRSPKTSSIAVTSGLIQNLTRDELQGVVAHETAHIVNRDVQYMTLLGTMAGAIAMLADVGRRSLWYGGGGRRRSSRSGGGGGAEAAVFIVALLLVLLAPLFANLVYFACSRRREYLADACAVQYTRYPDGLASALEKIGGAARIESGVNRVLEPMFIENPSRRAAAGAFATHPSIQDRVKVLRGLGGVLGLSAYQKAWSRVAGRGAALFSPEDMTSKFHAAPVGRAEEEKITAPVEERSKLNDFFWEKSGYLVLECSCGTRMKIPPAFKKDVLSCPRCGTSHALPRGN